MAGIRLGYELDDSQTLIVALLRSLTASSPWSSWEVINGFPTVDIFALQKPVIYVYQPLLLNTVRQLGGQPALVTELTIGAWCEFTQEINIIAGQLLRFFLNGKAAHSQPFDVEIGGEVTQGCTVIDHKVIITKVSSPQWIFSDVKDSQFRVELSINLLIGG